MNPIQKLERWLEAALVSRLCQRDPQVLLDTLGPLFNRSPNLDDMPFDLSVQNGLQFEHFAGLFASNSLNHGVISLTIRQAAYLFGLIRQMKAKKVIEIGRYKGGSTFLIAAAMAGEGEFWSIDNDEKERRLYPPASGKTFDEQWVDLSRRFGLKARLIVGDSRTVELDTGEVDLVLIDGDHTYEGVRSDFERFGKRVRVGGAVLLDDAFDDGFFKTELESVNRLANEIVAGKEFKFIRSVNRFAHLERVQPNV